MDMVFKLTNEKKWKSLVLDDDRVYVSTKAFEEKEAFMRHFPEKGLLQPTKDSFPIKRIRKMERVSDEKKLTVYDAEDKRPLVFHDEYTMHEFIAYINERRGFTATPSHVSTLGAIAPGLWTLFFTSILFFTLYTDALTIEEGGQVQIQGRRKLFKAIFAQLARFLGTRGSIVLGVLGVGIAAALIYRGLKNPPSKVVYEKLF